MNYYDRVEISNSDLKIFKNEGPANFYKYKYSGEPKPAPTPQMIFGSMVHCMILEPHLVDKTYVVFKGKKPASSNMEAFCNDIIAGNDVLNAYIKNYSTKGLKPDQIETKAIELYTDLSDYINTVANSKDKTFIAENDYDRAMTITMHYLDDAYVFQDFREKEVLNKNVTIFIEHEIFWTHPSGVKCKAKIDKLIIDHDNKIIHLIDLKTTSCAGSRKFKESIRTYDYISQVAFYTQGINYCFSEYIQQGYTIQNRLIALQTESPFCIGIYEIDNIALLDSAIINNGYLKTLSKLIDVSTGLPKKTSLNIWSINAVEGCPIRVY